MIVENLNSSEIYRKMMLSEQEKEMTFIVMN